MRGTSLRDEHAQATRNALIKAGRKLFASQGYAQVSTEELVQAARVTRGALYHHFADKRDLFRAIAHEISDEINQDVEAAALSAPTVWDGLIAGIDVFLDACLERDTYRILILDGPAVLDWSEWWAKDSAAARGLLAVGLTKLMDDGVIERQPVDILAHQILGAMNVSAILIATADDRAVTRTEVGASLERLVSGLRTG